MQRRFCFAIAILCLFVAAPALAADTATAVESAPETGFEPLFDGESLDGWVKHGGKASYAIEDGEIVGASTRNTPNTFLCTPRDYGDFILEVELKVDDGLNSGIQIRSHVFEESKTVEIDNPNGEPFKARISAGRVHGYQVEIDPSARSWSGGIYDEARRGWLNKLDGDQNKAAREAFRNNDWNHYRIEAVGSSIKTFVNGVPAADLTDEVDASGFIALQVHSIGNDESKEGKQVRWRKLRIKEL